MKCLILVATVQFSRMSVFRLPVFILPVYTRQIQNIKETVLLKNMRDIVSLLWKIKYVKFTWRQRVAMLTYKQIAPLHFTGLAMDVKSLSEAS